MRETATTLTDFGLAVLCGAFALNSSRGPFVFFSGFSAAAAFGGTWHGYFSDQPGFVADFVWWLSVVCAGLAALGLALTGMERLGLAERRAPARVAACVWLAFACWSWHDARFVWCLAATLLGTALCVAGLLLRPAPGAILALAGFGVSVVAAIAQQRGVALHSPVVDHNATYHLLLVPALALIYSGLKRTVAATRRSPNRPEAPES